MSFELQAPLVGPGKFELEVSGQRYGFRCSVEPVRRSARCTGDRRDLLWRDAALEGFSLPLSAVRDTPLTELTSRDGVRMSARRLRVTEGRPITCAAGPF